MSFKKIVFVGVGFVAAAGLAYVYFDPGVQAPMSSNARVGQSSAGIGVSPAAPLPAATPSDVTAEAPKLGTRTVDLSYNTASFKGAPLPERLVAMSARRNGRAFDPEQVANALKSDVAWETDPTVADKLPVTLTSAERKDGREFVRVNPLKIEALMTGDEISLPIKQQKTATPMRMVVDQVESGIGGNITWHGHLKDFGSENQVSLTRGDGNQADTLIVGGVSVPDKNYVVQIYGGAGWIVDGFAIFKGRHDAIKPGTEGGVHTDSGHSH